MRRSIKTKILLSTSLVVLVSLLISSFITYLAFLNILKDQMIRDDGARLQQSKTQMEYVVDDIRKFSYNIALDSTIQSYLTTKSWPSPIDELRSIDATRKKISEFAKLRDYIQRAAVVRLDGAACANLKEFDEYIQQSLSEPWFTDYSRSSAQPYFSNPHITQSERSSVENVVSYVMSIKDVNRPMEVIGYLVLNIYYSHFASIIEPQSSASEAYLWLGAGGSPIYEKKLNGKSILPAALAGGGTATQSGPALLKAQDGYVLLTDGMSNGWRLASYTSNASLMGRTSNILVIFILFILASLVLITSIILPIVLGITKPITKLTRVMGEVAGGNMDAVIRIESGDEVQVLGEGFNRMIAELKQYIDKSIRDEKTKREMEFSLLLSQINPHFIYNTLNTVIYMAKKENNEDIARMMESFIRILQDAVKPSEQGAYATLRQEIAVAGHYAAIQQYRYPGRFRVEWDIPEEIQDAQVPRTILQPLIENALIHGILPAEREGEIRVRAELSGGDVLLAVADNGVGMDSATVGELLRRPKEPADRSAMRSIGIPNIIGRIRYLYGREYGLEIQSAAGEGTKVTVRIPFQESLKNRI